MMPSELTFSLCACVLLILLSFVLQRLGHDSKITPAVPKPPRPKRDHKPFAGLTHKPECELCGRESEPALQVPGAPPPPMILSRDRRRQIDTTGHFCP
jgi:hypothetical protein